MNMIHHRKHWATSFSCRRLPLQSKQRPNLLFEEKLTVDNEFFDKYDPIWGKHHCIHPQEVVNGFDRTFSLKTIRCSRWFYRGDLDFVSFAVTGRSWARKIVEVWLLNSIFEWQLPFGKCRVAAVPFQDAPQMASLNCWIQVVNPFQGSMVLSHR